MAAVDAYKKKHHIKPLCEYIFDEHGAVGEWASEIIKSLQRNKTIRSVTDSLPVFKDDKLVLPLQAADLYAWNARDYLVKDGRVAGRHINIKRTLFELPQISIAIGQDLLEGVRANVYASAILNQRYLRN